MQGKVYIRITISEDGSVKDPTIMRSLDTYCDKEAIRVMNSLPKWNPGKQNGKSVPVYYVIPIEFKLQ
jgi:protein TonB